MRTIPVYRALVLTLALLAGGLTQPAFGVALTVNNAGFEAPGLAPQDIDPNNLTGWSLHDPLNGVTDVQWGALNPSGSGGSTFGVNTGYVSNSAAEGSNVAFLFCCANGSNNAEFAIEQTLSATFTAGTQYNLSVEVGNEGSYSDFFALGGQILDGFPGYRVELLAGNTVIGVDDNSVAIADGSFGTSNVTVTFAEGDPTLTALSGQNLKIRLWNLGADPGNDPSDGEAEGFEVDFDDVAINTFAGPTADANGPYSFSAGNLSVTLDGSGSTDPDNDIASYSWAIGATQVATGQMPALDIADSGLMSTIDTGNVELTVTDAVGFESTDTAALVYTNALPIVIDAMGTELMDLSMVFTANFDDPDLIVNGLIPGFEMLELEISLTNIFGSGFITGMGASLMDTIDRATLEGILGGGAGPYTLFANVRDKAGASAALSFDILLSDPGVQPVPAPATGALFALALAGLGLRRRRG